MADVDEMPNQLQLSRLQRRQQFKWFHRLAPVLVMFAYSAMYVIKSWDEYFDVTGMVKFSVGLLVVVLCLHLAILESLLYVKSYAADCIQTYDDAMARYGMDPDPESQDRTRFSDKSHLEDKRVCNKRRDIDLAADVEQDNYSSTTGPGYFKFENMKHSVIGRYSLATDNGYSSEMTSSSDCGPDDSSWSADSSSSTSSSSSYCDIDDDHLPPSSLISSSSSSSSSSSYCEINLIANHEMSSAPLIAGSSYGHFASSTSLCSPQYSLKATVSANEVMRDSNVSTAISPSILNVARENPEINMTKQKQQIPIQSKMSTIRGMSTVISRLRSLQDIYVVVDVFKALLCLDVLRQLIVYYSIFYWRLSILQTLPVFVLPSVVIVGEVSLTVVCFIS